MAIGLANTNPIVGDRILLQINDAEVTESRFRDAQDREQQQFQCELLVVSGAGERDGETFVSWFAFRAGEDIRPGTKTGQLLRATLGADAQAETLDELARKLVGKRFVANLEASRSGEYARVVHETLAPAPADDDNEEISFDDLPL